MPIILELCEELHALESRYKNIPFDKEFTRTRIEAVLNSKKEDQIILLAYDKEEAVGIIIGLTSPLLFSPKSMSCEPVWYVRPSHLRKKQNLELVQAYEYWAHKVGCTVVSIGKLALNGIPQKDSYLKRHNYHITEVLYTKEFK